MTTLPSQDQRLRVIKWYLEGAGIMSIERMEGVPNPLIIKWIRNFLKLLRQKLNATPIPEDAKNIQILGFIIKKLFCIL